MDHRQIYSPLLVPPNKLLITDGRNLIWKNEAGLAIKCKDIFIKGEWTYLLHELE